LTCPNLTGFQLAKTRGHDVDGISVMSTILVSLRNVIYISHYIRTCTKMQDYRRILAISTASSSEKIGTAFDLCMVPIPLTFVPV
jgi:hypothetical protein